LFAKSVGDKLLVESGDAPSRLRREPVLSLPKGSAERRLRSGA
jgi:hypothetical protein